MIGVCSGSRHRGGGARVGFGAAGRQLGRERGCPAACPCASHGVHISALANVSRLGAPTRFFETLNPRVVGI